MSDIKCHSFEECIFSSSKHQIFIEQESEIVLAASEMATKLLFPPTPKDGPSDAKEEASEGQESVNKDASIKGSKLSDLLPDFVCKEGTMAALL